MANINILDCIPNEDDALCEWLQNFASVAKRLETEAPEIYKKLGLSENDLMRSIYCKERLLLALAELANSVSLERHATRHRETARAEVEAIVRVRAEGIRNDKDVHLTVKQELGIVTKPPLPSLPPPVLLAPNNLKIDVLSHTQNELSWDYSTNADQEALYQLAAAIGDDVEMGIEIFGQPMEAKPKSWTFLVTTSDNSYIHNTKEQPDVAAFYRVRTKRGNAFSEWSNEVQVNTFIAQSSDPGDLTSQ